MANYLLVHGAWHGAWCWQRVLPGLIQAGHRAHAVTLTGVGERAHLLNPGIDLETHIQDVMAAMDAEEMDDVILVVHSYAGMLGTAVADRRPTRLRHLVYLDAVLPKPGESWSSTHASTTREARLAAITEARQRLEQRQRDADLERGRDPDAPPTELDREDLHEMKTPKGTSR